MKELQPASTDEAYSPCPGMTATDFARDILNKHPITLRRFCEKERVAPEELCSLVDDVLTDWELVGETHDTRQDATRHMINHIRKKIYAKRNRSQNPRSSSRPGCSEDERMAAIAQAILRQSAGGAEPR